MYKEMMMNDDNVESSLLTSNLLKICSLYKFCYKLYMLSCRWTELCRVPASMKCVVQVVCWGHMSIYSTTVYYRLHGSTMGCSLRVTRAGVADREYISSSTNSKSSLSSRTGLLCIFLDAVLCRAPPFHPALHDL